MLTEKDKRYRQSDKGRAVRRAWDQRYRQSAKGRAFRRAWERLQKYGVTDAAYYALFAAQRGLCAICQRPPCKQRLSVDHDHATGQVRGLLCMKCNTAIGMFRDNSTLCRLGAEYLEATGH